MRQYRLKISGAMWKDANQPPHPKEPEAVAGKLPKLFFFSPLYYKYE